MWRPQYNNRYQLESEMGQGASLSELDFFTIVILLLPFY